MKHTIAGSYLKMIPMHEATLSDDDQQWWVDNNMPETVVIEVYMDKRDMVGSDFIGFLRPNPNFNKEVPVIRNNKMIMFREYEEKKFFFDEVQYKKDIAY